MSLDGFDASDYLARYPEVAALGMDPREHFETFGDFDNKIYRFALSDYPLALKTESPFGLNL